MRNTAIYHLPGLFEFYELYRRFLPLFRTHREYFYDWCEIGSLYGAPENCLWGGGRFSCGECDPQAMMALLREYGISARLTFSNSLLREEHLADERCNALCRLLAESDGPQNGVIVHSDLLAGYLKEHYPQLYLVSSTTKVLTEFEAFRQETAREDFAYVVPDFRLNKAFAQLETLARAEKDKVEFLCNECCWTGCRDRKRCYEVVSRQNLGRTARITAVPRPTRRRGTAFPKPCGARRSSGWRISRKPICPWAFPISRSRGGAWAARWCWNFCSTIWSSRSTSWKSGKKFISTTCWTCSDRLRAGLKTGAGLRIMDMEPGTAVPQRRTSGGKSRWNLHRS